MATSQGAAQTRQTAPARLVKWLGERGYDVDMLVTRAPEATCDPGAEVPFPWEPFTDEDVTNIGAIVAAYDGTDGPLDAPPPSP